MNKIAAQKKIESERPPVVVIMGHIDHGKSTLLDYIRKSNITAKEAGGITQHLGAYEVLHKTQSGKSGKITFLDTPGHEAFTSIRSRGAHVADIAVLVVSAEDGVKKQTLEALAAIKESDLPYIVAINKIDKPSANIELTKQNLAEHEIYIEGYGGDVPAVPISAITGAGVPELLDMIMLVAEIKELKASTSDNASGTIIDARLDTKKGISATLLIKNGTLTTGMYVVAENAISPVRIFEDFLGKPIKSATFSSPVRVIGFNKIPPAGAEFISFNDKKEAEAFASNFKAPTSKPLPERHSDNQINDDTEKTIVPLIIKSDVIGSLEGIRHEISKLHYERVFLRIITDGIGDISESDVKLASSDPNTILIGFNVKADSKARAVIERQAVNVQLFTIIYKLIEYIDSIAKERAPKTITHESLGRAKVLQVFSKNKDRQIIGGKVQEGIIKLGSEVKILRRDIEIGTGKVKELQQQKKKADEVATGFEFGTLIESKVEIAIGDKIEAFVIVEK